MSAWYIFAALGLYPVDPLTSEYEVTTPLFERLTLHLENGRTFTISAPGLSSTRRYIQSAQLNGKPWEKTYIDYETLRRGGSMTFTLGAKATSWGTHASARPYSFSRAKK